MATGTGKIYTKALASAFNGEIDYDTDTIKVALCSAIGTQDASDYFDDVTEISAGNGYTASGITLTTKSVTPGTAAVVFDADDVVWTASGGSIAAAYAVIYKSTGTAGTSPLISYVDFGGTQTATDGNTFTISWDGTNGVFKGTVTT
jgi:hypothetical protein